MTHFFNPIGHNSDSKNKKSSSASYWDVFLFICYSYLFTLTNVLLEQEKKTFQA